MVFSIKSGSLELRSCNDSLLSSEPHTTAEIIYWDMDSKNEPYCYAVAFWKPSKEGFDLHFVGSRPFDPDIDTIEFMTLAKIGQLLTDAMFDEIRENN